MQGVLWIFLAFCGGYDIKGKRSMSEKTKKERFERGTRRVPLVVRLINALFFGEDALKSDYYRSERVKDIKRKQR